MTRSLFRFWINWLLEIDGSSLNRYWGKVFRKAPLLEERLYKNLKARGVDNETIKKLKALWKKNAYK